MWHLPCHMCMGCWHETYSHLQGDPCSYTLSGNNVILLMFSRICLHVCYQKIMSVYTLTGQRSLRKGACFLIHYLAKSRVYSIYYSHNHSLRFPGLFWIYSNGKPVNGCTCACACASGNKAKPTVNPNVTVVHWHYSTVPMSLYSIIHWQCSVYTWYVFYGSFYQPH